jgi:putative endonuclease
MGSSEYHWVYILQVRGGCYYTGSTADLHRRYEEHVLGTGGCRYTRSFPPVGLMQCWSVKDSRGEALRIEAYIKRQPRKTKTELIGNPASLFDLMRSEHITAARIEPCKKTLIRSINLRWHEKGRREKEVKTRRPLK